MCDGVQAEATELLGDLRAAEEAQQALLETKATLEAALQEAKERSKAAAAQLASQQEAAATLEKARAAAVQVGLLNMFVSCMSVPGSVPASCYCNNARLQSLCSVWCRNSVSISNEDKIKHDTSGSVMYCRARRLQCINKKPNAAPLGIFCPMLSMTWHDSED